MRAITDSVEKALWRHVEDTATPSARIGRNRPGFVLRVRGFRCVPVSARPALRYADALDRPFF
jgi:hypothetical protein